MALKEAIDFESSMYYIQYIEFWQREELHVRHTLEIAMDGSSPNVYPTSELTKSFSAHTPDCKCTLVLLESY